MSVDRIKQWVGWIAASGVAWLVMASAAAASPVDLEDPTPRWISVRFETSPQDAPWRLDEIWGEARRAFLSRSRDGRDVEIRIPADEVIEQLRSTGADPVEGSFSDFVWTIEPETGHVVRAELVGELRESFSFGLFRSSAVVAIRVEMTTFADAGYRPMHHVMGKKSHPYCTSGDEARDCTLVAAARFDRDSGYVNAVGTLRAATPLIEIRTFSPLGEVLFSERDENAPNSVVSGTSSHESVCSSPMNGSCRPDLRGESS